MNYEGLRQDNAAVSTFTVPLPEWRTGDFSGLRNAAGQPIVIYDPATTRPDPANPGQFIRDPFPGNRIPAERISAVARAMMAYWPLPNISPTNAFTQTNNYSLSGTQSNKSDRIDSRVDHVFNNQWRTFVRYSFSNDSDQPFNSFGNLASSSGGDGPTYTKTHSVSIDNNYTLGPTWMLNVRYGLNRRLVDRLPLSAGFDLASLGLPANVIDVTDAFEFPRVNVQNFQSLGQDDLHRPRHRADDAQLQRQCDEGVGHAHDEDGRRLPEVPAQLHPALLPVGPVRLQQCAVDAAQPECHERHRRPLAGVDAPRHSEQHADQPQPVARLGQLLLVRVRAGRLEAGAQPHAESRPALSSSTFRARSASTV